MRAQVPSAELNHRQCFDEIFVAEMTEQIADFVDEDLEEIMRSIAFEVRELSEGNFENRFDPAVCDRTINSTLFEYLNFINVSTGQIICSIRLSKLRFRFFPNLMDRRRIIGRRRPHEVLQIFAQCLDDEFGC
jgi:hypothetical protein